MQVKKDEKRHPDAFTTKPGRFLKKKIGAFGPPRRYETQEKNTHTSQNAGRHKKSRKKAYTSQAHRNSQRQQQVFIMSQPSSIDKETSTDKAPITDKSTDDPSNSWESLRRSGEAAPTRKGTPPPVPASDCLFRCCCAKHVPTHIPGIYVSYVKHTPLLASETAPSPTLK